MSQRRPVVLIVCNQAVHDVYLAATDRQRLAAFADWRWLAAEGGQGFSPNEDQTAIAQLQAHAPEADAIIVCHGSPRIDDAVLAQAPRLRVVGELEGDRFAYRIDTEACWQRGIKTIDTTNGSSYPVSEWALALTLIALRNAGEHFRRITEPVAYRRSYDEFGYLQGELWGKRVGLIGCGHIGRRLISFLKPFRGEIWVHDPYLDRQVADLLDFTLTSLDNVMSQCDAVICLAPLTPHTRRMIGQRELDLLRPGTVFVNVSRGAIVDPEALIARLKRGDICAGLDVFDPEPIPADSEIKRLPNVFLSPHIAGVTLASRSRFFTLMVDELERFFHGHETLFDLTPRTLDNRRGRLNADGQA